MKSLSKFYITLASLMAGMIAVCSIPEISAKYQKSESGDGFLIQFPIYTAGETVAVGVGGTFSGILNDPEDFETLTDQMNQSSGTRSDLTYIGNVDGGIGNINGTDVNTLNQLFGDSLTMDFYNTETGEWETLPVTLIIKRVSTDTTNDTAAITYERMILYTTAEKISGRTQLNAEVYAMVFELQNDGEWVQNPNEMFKGIAPYDRYGDGWGSGLGGLLAGYNSFNQDEWESSEAYYGVAAGSAISDIINAYNNQTRT